MKNFLCEKWSNSKWNKNYNTTEEFQKEQSYKIICVRSHQTQNEIKVIRQKKNKLDRKYNWINL